MFSSIGLAGGISRRLGRNKLREQIGGKPLLSWVVGTLGELGGDIILVAAAGQDVTFFPVGEQIKVTIDVYPGGGVLGGIYTGLTVSDSFYNLVVACDMPFLNPSLLRYLLEAGDGYDAAVPRIGGMIEPLHAIYSRECLPFIKKEIEAGRRDIRSFFSRIRVHYVESEEIDRFDPDHLSFFNINTPEDLERARQIAIEKGFTGNQTG